MKVIAADGQIVECTIVKMTARREGREISDDELAGLRADNQALTDSVLAKLE